MDAEELFLRHVATIDRIAACVCRRHGVRDDDAAEFAAEVRLRLIENDYAVIRKFEGRSKFSTYLMTVITRMFHQMRVEQWGKWRPSAEAKRLGPKAVLLEQLMTRDGLSFSEAVQVLQSRGYTREELEPLYVRLPPRQPRPMLVPEEASADVVAAERADGPVIAHEQECVARKVAAVLDRLMETLPAEDQLILRMRFWHSRKVAEIAQILHLDQKKLYKRLERLFATMRQALAEAGIERDDIHHLFEGFDQES